MSNIKRIEEYIKHGINSGKRLGLELEHLVYNDEYEVITYDEMEDCLKEISKLENAKPYMENSRIMGVWAKGYSLSLEPGCQLEISIDPCEAVEDILSIYGSFRKIADKVIGEKGYKLHNKAMLPFIENGTASVDSLPLIPKERYRVMDEHFKTSGKNGRYMMRATASTQISVDFSSEEDAVKKMRVLEKLAPLISLITENRNGTRRIERFKPYLIRNQIWNDVDGERCGYIGAAEKDFSIEKYAKYIYEHNSILVKDNGVLKETNGLSAQQWYKERELCDEDTDQLLSMYFPNVRLKKYIEFRAADSMEIEDAAAFAVLIKNMVYIPKVLDGIDKMLENYVTKDIYAAEESIIEKGWDAVVYGMPVLDLAQDIFDIVLKNASDDDKDRIRSLIPITLADKQYLDIVKGHEQEHLSQAENIREYLMNSTAKYHNRVVKTLYIPKIFTKKETAIFKQLITDLYGIFDKVIDRYINDVSYRKEFGFSKEIEELITLKPLYGVNVPMARIDIFFDEKTRMFKFCEFNTDGASAMNEDRELNIAFSKSSAYKEFSKRYKIRSFELFDTWVEEALKIYEQCGFENKKPHIAIVDFMEFATINEFYIFKEAFEKKGCRVTICDIREISFDGENCLAKGEKVDLIYRRAVTSDIMSHPEESKGFMEAFKSGKVCVLGDFRTQVAHNKILYKILHSEKTQSFLTAKERDYVKDHIPYTVSLDEIYEAKNSALKKDVYENKDNWIIKPEDSYGSKGVCAGVELDDDTEWIKRVENAKNKKYILQEFCTPYRLENIILTAEKQQWTDTSDLTGLFVYNGRFVGIYSRVSYEQMISTQYNEMSLPTMEIY